MFRLLPKMLLRKGALNRAFFSKLYTKNHEWVEYVEDRNCYRVGITNHAQEQLGEIVLAEVTSLNKNVKVGEAAAVLESVKTTADIYAPADGKVLTANE